MNSIEESGLVKSSKYSQRVKPIRDFWVLPVKKPSESDRGVEPAYFSLKDCMPQLSTCMERMNCITDRLFEGSVCMSHVVLLQCFVNGEEPKEVDAAFAALWF